MAKKGKDTLNKLNKFLQETGTEPLEKSAKTGKKAFLDKAPTSLIEIEAVEHKLKDIYQLPDGQLKEGDLADLIKIIALNNNTSIRQVLYRVISKSLEKIPKQDSTDLMLQSTCMYLEYHDLLNQELNKG